MTTYIYVMRESVRDERPICVYKAPSEQHRCASVKLQGPSEVVSLDTPLRPLPGKEIWICVVTEGNIILTDPVPM